MKKYNDFSQNISDWTNKKLTEEAMAYGQMINGAQCYGTRDLRMFRGILSELVNRGIELNYKITFN